MSVSYTHLFGARIGGSGWQAKGGWVTPEQTYQYKYLQGNIDKMCIRDRYLSVVLFGALLAASAGTFTSCKEYDDDIKGLQEQIDKSGSSTTDLQTQLTTLKAAAEAAQATADAAKAAAR